MGIGTLRRHYPQPDEGPAEEPEVVEQEEEAEPLEVPDLTGVVLKKLPDAVAEIDDVRVLEALKGSDSRSGSIPIYEARIQELA